MCRKNLELHIQRSKPPKTTARPRFKVVLEASHDPTDADGSRRLRGALKRLLRSFGLKCIRVEPAVHQGQELTCESPSKTASKVTQSPRRRA